MAKEDLIVRIGASSENFRKELNKVGKGTKVLESQLKTVAKGAGVIFAGLSASVVGFTTVYSKFDNDIRAVKTLLDDSSFGAKSLDEGFKKLRKDTLGVFGSMPVDLESLNKGLFDTVSAGVDASKSVDSLKASAKLAVAGVTEVSVGVDGVTSALNAYSMEAEKSELVAAKYFIAQKQGKTTVEEMATHFGKAGATASSFGVSLDELLASVSAATTGGMKTQSAYTSLNAVLANIAKPTAEAAAEAKRLGIQFDSQSLRAKGLNGFINDLTKANGFNKQSIEKLFGSVEAQKIMFALTGAQAGKFKETLMLLGDEQKSLTQLNDAYNVQSQSLQNQLKLLKNQATQLSIAIGEKLAPYVQIVTGALGKFLNLLKGNDRVAELAAGFTVVGIAAAGIVGTLALAATAFLNIRKAIILTKIATKALGLSVKSLMGATGIGLLIVILSELYVHWDTIWPNIVATTRAAIKVMGDLIGGFGKLMLGAFTMNFELVKQGWNELSGAISKGVDEFKNIKASYKVEQEGDQEGGFAQNERNKTQIAQEESDKRREIADSENTAQSERDANLKLETYERQVEFNEMMAELKATDRELYDTLREEDKQKLLQDFESRKQLRTQEAVDKFNDNKKERTQYLKDEIKYGKTIAKLKAFQRSENYQGAKTASSELMQLQQSENSKMREIGKAAARVNAAMATYEGAIKAYSSLAGIPIVGPALGMAAAGAIMAYGVEQQRNIGKAETGGRVGSAFFGAGDIQPYMLEAGEFITPAKNYDETIDALTSQRMAQRDARKGASEPDESGISAAVGYIQKVIIGFTEDAFEIIEEKMYENKMLGLSK